jgi:1,4-dihydroxy-2-naphthoate octaprenyltransferase
VTLAELWELGRPPTLVASLVPVLVGAAAAGVRFVQWGPCVVMLAVAVLLQMATNMTNEYADYRRGVDAADSKGIAGYLVRGHVPPAVVLRWALTTYAVAFVLGLALVWLRGPLLLVLGLASIGAGFLYNAGPRPVSATPWGEALVFVVMGPLEVLVSEVAAAGRWTPVALWASVSVGFLVAAILMANNLRDLEGDRTRGRRTLAIRLGAERARRTLWGLTAAGLVWPPVAAALGLLPPWSALTLLALPVAWTTVADLARPEGLRRAVPLAGRLHLLGGLLLAVGLWLG